MVLAVVGEIVRKSELWVIWGDGKRLGENVVIIGQVGERYVDLCVLRG